MLIEEDFGYMGPCVKLERMGSLVEMRPVRGSRYKRERCFSHCCWIAIGLAELQKSRSWSYSLSKLETTSLTLMNFEASSSSIL